MLLNILVHEDVNKFKEEVYKILRFIYDEELEDNENFEIVTACLEYYEEHHFFPRKNEIIEKAGDHIVNFLEVKISENLYHDIQVTEKHYRESLIQTLFMQGMGEKSIENRQKILDQLYNLNFSLLEKTNLTTTDKYNVDQWVDDLKSQSLGLKLGIGLLDDLIYGVGYGRVFTVMAQTGHLKTTFGINVLYRAIKSGYNVLVLTLELTKQELYFNILSRHSYEMENPLSAESIKKGFTKKEDIMEVDRDFKKEFASRLMIMDQDEVSFKNHTEFRGLLNRIEDKFSFDVLLIDYFQLLKHMTSTRFRQDELNDYIIGMRGIALGFHGKTRIICILAQVKRSAYDKAVKQGGRYNVADMSDTSELEKTSSYILSLYKPPNEDHVCIYQLLKNRHGRSMPDIESMNVEAKYYFMGDDIQGGDVINSETIEEVMSDAGFDEMDIGI